KSAYSPIEGNAKKQFCAGKSPLPEYRACRHWSFKKGPHIHPRPHEKKTNPLFERCLYTVRDSFTVNQPLAPREDARCEHPHENPRSHPIPKQERKRRENE